MQLKKLNVKKLNPPVWARGGHLQTIMSHIIPSPKVADLGEKVVIPLADGEKLVGYLKPGRSKVFISLFHGLAGDVNSYYIQRMALLCEKLGYGRLIVNHRGAGEGVGLAQKPYHSGRGEDASDVIKFLRQRFPEHKHLAIGFSMSGSILLNLLSGRRGTEKPDFAITVNAPLDLHDGALRLKRGLNRIYDFRFVKKLADEIRGRHKDQYKITLKNTIYDLDEIFTGPEGGFGNRDGYYRECSTFGHLHKIDRPTVMLTAADDPFVSVDSYLKANYSPFVKLHIEPTGGHVGYYSGKPMELVGRRWLDYFLIETIKEFENA